MKFNSKQPEYQSKKRPFPTYKNSYVRDGKIEIGRNSEFLNIEYLFCHTVQQTVMVDGVEEVQDQEVIISETLFNFTEDHQPTIMDVGGQEVEVYQAILTGETYDKSKIVSWGRPDLHKVMTMFELSSLTNKETGIVIKDLQEVSVQGNIIPINDSQSAQIKQLMIDWLSENVYIENEKLSENFEFNL